MGQWSIEWSECDPVQCWVELWFQWCSGSIRDQLTSKFDCVSSSLELEVEFEDWAIWKGCRGSISPHPGGAQLGEVTKQPIDDSDSESKEPGQLPSCAIEHFHATVGID